MDPVDLLILKLCAIPLIGGIVLLLGLVVVIKAGVYLDDRRHARQVTRELLAEEKLKNERRRMKEEIALAWEEDDRHFKKWEEFYDELHRAR